jgi:hypothetical protein
MWGSKVYSAWNNMKNRCDNFSNPKSKNYFGRGITYCDSWKDFSNFYGDMGNPPKEEYSLDRIRVNEGYSKGNCRWASASTQSSNRRTHSNTGEKYISLVKRKTTNLFLVSVPPFKHFRFLEMKNALEARDILVDLKNFIAFKEDTMIPVTLTYGKTKNLGDYNSEKVEITYQIAEDDDVYECFETIRNLVEGGFQKPLVSGDTLNSKGALNPVKSTAAKAKVANKEEAPKEESKKEEVKKDDKKAEKEAEKAAKAEEKAATKAAAKVTIYDRENGLHKKKLASVLTEQYPSWKTDESLKKNALSASQTLHEAKTPFIDGDLEKGGQVVQEFLDKLKEIMEG